MNQPPRHMTRLGLFQDQPWSDRALCAQTDPDAFFPEKGGSTRDPKKVCTSCEVREECLDWALATDQAFGIWGGHSERERRKLKKQQPEQLAATGTDGPTLTTTEDEQPALVQYGGTYVAGTGHRPLPLATSIGVRPAHKPAAPKPTGLDWTKHTAPEPATDPQPTVITWPCRGCGQKSSDLDNDLCPSCRDAADAKFHVPTAVPDLPTEGKQGQPTTGSSAPGATSTSSTTGRAPVAGPSTHREKDPEPVQETRPATGSGLLHVVEHCAQLLRDTARSTDPLVQMLRGSALSVLAALDHAHHPETPVAAASPGVAAPVERPVAGKAATGSSRTQRPRRSSRSTVDLAKARQLLDQGHSCPQIAAELGVGVKAVRTALDNAGIPRPDGRTTHSGGQPRQYDTQTVADVRRLYLDEHLSRQQVADQLDLPYKTVVTIMAHHAIPARQRQAGNLDGARTLKDRIAALGVTSRDIKTWALAQGLITDLKRGLPGLELVDAYAAAHPTNRKENQ